MPMDASIAELLSQSMVQLHAQGMGNIAVAGQNLAQGLGVINNLMTQQNAGVADDPTVLAGLSTASRIPDSGALPAK